MQAEPLYSPSRALKLKLHASLFTHPPSLASYTLTSTFASSTGGLLFELSTQDTKRTAQWQPEDSAERGTET